VEELPVRGTGTFFSETKRVLGALVGRGWVEDDGLGLANIDGTFLCSVFEEPKRLVVV
jgi:hypothetical protein